MPLQILQNDITRMKVDAIVNAANESLLGGGVDGCIHRAAGPELLKECRHLGGCRTGNAKITKGYALPCKYVIHTVGPVWQGGGHEEENLLRQCYDSALNLALEHQCESIAFPLISTGNYGFPKDRALQIAISAFSAFLLEHEMRIYLVVFHKDAFRLSEKLFHRVASYIDENYVQAKETAEYGAAFHRSNRSAYRRRRDMEVCESSIAFEEPLPCASKAMSLEDMLKQADAGFTETLLKLIDQTGKKDSEIYKKANISKQHFSKIRNNPNYKPTKATAMALAIALELNIEETSDLIGRAGFALTNSSKQDLIVKYFIENKNYNIVEINLALYEFDQGLLGSA